VDEAGTGHRLDRRQDWTLLAGETVDEVRKAVTIGRASSGRGSLAIGEHGVPVETLAAEVESDVQHRWASFVVDRPECLRPGGPSSSDSLRVRRVQVADSAISL